MILGQNTFPGKIHIWGKNWCEKAPPSRAAKELNQIPSSKEYYKEHARHTKAKSDSLSAFIYNNPSSRPAHPHRHVRSRRTTYRHRVPVITASWAYSLSSFCPRQPPCDLYTFLFLSRRVASLLPVGGGRGPSSTPVRTFIYSVLHGMVSPCSLHR